MIQDKAEGGVSEQWSGGGPPVARKDKHTELCGQETAGSMGFTRVLLCTACWGQRVGHLPLPSRGCTYTSSAQSSVPPLSQVGRPRLD